MSSTEIISHSVLRTIVLVGYGTGTVLGANGLRYEYVSLYTSVHVFSRFSIENVLLSVALRTGTLIVYCTHTRYDARARRRGM